MLNPMPSATHVGNLFEIENATHDIRSEASENLRRPEETSKNNCRKPPINRNRSRAHAYISVRRLRRKLHTTHAWVSNHNRRCCTPNLTGTNLLSLFSPCVPLLFRLLLDLPIRGRQVKSVKNRLGTFSSSPFVHFFFLREGRVSFQGKKKLVAI